MLVEPVITLDFTIPVRLHMSLEPVFTTCQTTYVSRTCDHTGLHALPVRLHAHVSRTCDHTWFHYLSDYICL